MKHHISKQKTTMGEIKFPDDYKDKWVILFSHPADFTPVCTTEFMTFATMQKEFKKLNTELIGLSIDSIYAHIAWLRTIKEKIEYKKRGGLFNFHRPRNHYVIPETIIKEMETAGFKVKEQYFFLPEQSFTIFSLNN